MHKYYTKNSARRKSSVRADLSIDITNFREEAIWLLPGNPVFHIILRHALLST